MRSRGRLKALGEDWRADLRPGVLIFGLESRFDAWKADFRADLRPGELI